MESPANTAQTWRFGLFSVDARNLELRRGGTPVKMREQSFRILVYLLEHAGEIVTREELRGVLWPADTFVDFDHSLNTAVMKLRDALGDSADAPLYIETIPKRGYRFIAPVAKAAEVGNGLAKDNGDSVPPLSVPPPTNETSEPPQAAPAPAEKPVLHRRLARTAVVAGLLVFAAAGAFLLVRARHSRALPDASQASSTMQIVPITTAPGNAISPVFSPDGREIAFVWDGAERKHYDVYVQLLGADLPLRLTYSKIGLLGTPAWSPEGREIAFTRCDGENDGVYVVPALGGAERKLTSVGCLYTLPSSLAWLVDGKGMLMIDYCSGRFTFGVVLFSPATGAKRCLTNSESPDGVDSGYEFALSPDGGTIAFTRHTSGLLCCDSIYTIPLSGGVPATSPSTLVCPAILSLILAATVLCGLRTANPSCLSPTGQRCLPCGSSPPMVGQCSARRRTQLSEVSQKTAVVWFTRKKAAQSRQRSGAQT